MAISQLQEAKGIDAVADRFKYLLTTLDGATPESKVQNLVLQKAKLIALDIRESLVKQAFDNLRSYFEGDLVSSEQL